MLIFIKCSHTNNWGNNCMKLLLQVFCTLYGHTIIYKCALFYRFFIKFYMKSEKFIFINSWCSFYINRSGMCVYSIYCNLKAGALQPLEKSSSSENSQIYKTHLPCSDCQNFVWDFTFQCHKNPLAALKPTELAFMRSTWTQTCTNIIRN